MTVTEAEQIFREELYRLPKKVVVLIPIPWETMAEDQVMQLGKILGYVKLSLAGVQILNYEEIEVANLKIFGPATILSFGTRLSPAVTTYEIHKVDGTQIIYADALGSMGDPEKRSLMSALKQAFTL